MNKYVLCKDMGSDNGGQSPFYPMGNHITVISSCVIPQNEYSLIRTIGTCDEKINSMNIPLIRYTYVN